METLLLLFLSSIILTILLIKIKINKWVKFLIVVFVVILLLDPKWLFNNYVSDYGKRLEPLKKEVSNVKNYQKATQFILSNWELIKEKNTERSLHQILDSKQLTKEKLMDSFIKIQKDSLKLRFLYSNSSIEKNDTIIVFKHGPNDYNMVSNKTDKLHEIPPYSIYKHSIIYSSKPIDTSRYITKIANNLYYDIDEYDEW